MTPLGDVVNGLMCDRFKDIVDVKFTARMEKKLDDVESGDVRWKDLIRQFYVPFHENLEKVENELHKEPPDHVLESVSRLVSAEQPVWTGSPSELADAVHAGMAANVLSKYLNVKSGRLLDEYHVRYENKVRHEGRRITLTYDAESK